MTLGLIVGGHGDGYMHNQVWFCELDSNPFKQGHERMGQGDEYEVVNKTFKFEIEKVKARVGDGNVPNFV
jgi:hypothetical protein